MICEEDCDEQGVESESFENTFYKTISIAKGIGEAEKFYYPKTHLDDSVKRLIAKIDVTSENYKTAWDIICQRFNNKKMLIHNHLKSLNGIPAISQESSGALEQLSDGVFEHLRSLKQLGVSTDNWDSYLISHLTSKLDRKTEDEWESYKIVGDIPMLDEFRSSLNDRADVLERKEHKHSSNSRHTSGQKDYFPSFSKSRNNSGKSGSNRSSLRTKYHANFARVITGSPIVVNS
ncbi:hypothetical protein JTB14_025726 [Gonioctena quinquepunctata]|nr:hypothetical protein JTB14_025726 [Gonioctena quinquepunctata]